MLPLKQFQRCLTDDGPFSSFFKEGRLSSASSFWASLLLVISMMWRSWLCARRYCLKLLITSDLTSRESLLMADCFARQCIYWVISIDPGMSWTTTPTGVFREWMLNFAKRQPRQILFKSKSGVSDEKWLRIQLWFNDLCFLMIRSSRQSGR